MMGCGEMVSHMTLDHNSEVRLLPPQLNVEGDLSENEV